MNDEKYGIQSYQSGTTWLIKNDRKIYEGFHFGYFKGGNPHPLFLINERGTKERDRYVYNIQRYLNESSSAGDSFLPYMEFVLFGAVTLVNESEIMFNDAYFGELRMQWLEVKGENWDKKPIPDDVMEDFIRFSERTNAKFYNF